MSSFDRNIDNLRRASNFNTSLANKYETENASAIGSTKQFEARQIASGLSDFSSSLKEWKKQDIKKQLAKGKTEFLEEKQVNAEKMAALQERLVAAKDNQIAIEEIKGEMLQLSGPDGKSEADRIGHLSSWAQVGYVKEKLSLFNNSVEDKLAYHMQNSERAISLQGVEFSAKQLRDHHITGLPMKEAALEVEMNELKKDAGLNKYSAEMLELAGTNEAIASAKEAQLTKFRERYNIDASAKQQAQLILDWNSSEKTGKDLYALILGSSNTVNEKNQLLGMGGGWTFALSQLTKEGIASTDRGAYADMIGDLVIPDHVADKLGIDRGTTYGKQWPNRIKELKTSISTAYVKNVKAQQEELKADQTALGNQFTILRRKGVISQQELEWFEQKSRDLGGEIDSRIKNYKTVSELDEEESEELIKNQIASNGGWITHAQLDTYNPRAASKYRDQATRHEAAFAKDAGAEKLIKGALNESWTAAGLKQKEKPLIYEYALVRANQDFERKWNHLVSMGFNPEKAMKLALNASQEDLLHPETGEPIEALQGFEGVVAEIKRNGANSKYTQESAAEKDSMKKSMIRLHHIDIGKKQMMSKEGYDPHTYQIGGEYGKERINEIIENIKAYGTWNGITKSEEALEYYRGLANGKRGWNAHSIIDAQLKFNGHPGIWPDRKPLTNEQKSDAALDKVNSRLDTINEATKYEGSVVSYNNLYNYIDELNNPPETGRSVWDLPENTWEVIQ